MYQDPPLFPSSSYFQLHAAPTVLELSEVPLYMLGEMRMPECGSGSEGIVRVCLIYRIWLTLWFPFNPQRHPVQNLPSSRPESAGCGFILCRSPTSKGGSSGWTGIPLHQPELNPTIVKLKTPWPNEMAPPGNQQHSGRSRNHQNYPQCTMKMCSSKNKSLVLTIFVSLAIMSYAHSTAFFTIALLVGRLLVCGTQFKPICSK